MQKEKSLQIGAKVKDLVHDSEGVIIDIVSEPEDGHHATFYKVRLKDGREVNLIEEQIG